jgi:hypothetical protein
MSEVRLRGAWLLTVSDSVRMRRNLHITLDDDPSLGYCNSRVT